MNKILSFVIITISLLLNFNTALAGNTGTILSWPNTFEERKSQYIYDATEGQYSQDYNCLRNLIWGLLEQDDPVTELEKQKIHLILKAMVHGWASVDGAEPDLMDSTGCDENLDDNTVGLFKSICMDNAFVPKILINYKNLAGDRITQADYDYILDEWEKEMIDKSLFVIASNGNQQINVMTGLYLYAEQINPQAVITYTHPCDVLGEGCEEDQRWFPFSYNGHSYEFGEKYNALQFSRDWLEWTLDKFVFTDQFSDRYTNVAYYFEFDGKYPHAYMSALAQLYSMAQDSLIKQKAKMVRDLFLLDYYMDFNGVASGGYHGGNPGRSGHSSFGYDYILFGFYQEMHPVYPERNMYTSVYDLPEVLIDAVTIEEEPIDYWHINMEYNPYLNNAEGQGKYTYVTKEEAIDGVSDSSIWDKLESVYPGVSLPFKRIEAVDYRGNKIIDWQNNVMTVAKNGRNCAYDFNQWTYQCSGSPSPPPPAKGDLNSDGKVDIIDLGILLSNWGSTTKPPADLNQDGYVDIIDLGIMLSNWD